MKPSIALFVATLLLTSTVTTVHHDYELSRGRNMWMGTQRAVHYLDRFTLLSKRLSGVTGLMSSYYPFLYQNEWSLAFELKKRGEDLSSKDGFMMLLSPQPVAPNEIEEETGNAEFLDTAVR